MLIADDDPDFASLAARALQREFAGAEIIEATDATALAQGLAAEPDLLVTDYALRWTDGFEVLDRLRAAWPGCPAVMFTGTGNEELAVRAIKAGFDDYVVKSPRQLRRLAAAARAAVTRADARRGLEENRDLLTKELYHRLHNNLQLVVGLIAFTARSMPDAESRSKLDDLGRRVQSLSLLQERLYRGGDFRRVDFAAFLRKLVDDVIGLHQREMSVTVDAAEAVLPVDLAVPLALTANELITNALKHAFPPEVREPRLVVAFAALDGGGHVLSVTDNGPGAAAESGTGGLGMRLVHRLAQQVGGTFTIGAAEGGGTACRITVRGRGDSAS